MRPSRSIVSSLNESITFSKCKHGNNRGECPECREEHEQWIAECEKQEAQYRDKREREAAEREAAEIKEHLEHPEYWLKKYGVPKKFMPCSFENFKGGDQIKEILRAFPENSILLSGSTGCGKTHLAVSTLRSLVQRRAIISSTRKEYIPDPFDGTVKTRPAEGDAIFATAPDLLLDIRSSFSRNDDEKELVKKYTAPDVLILDDLGADKPTEWAVSTLYLIIDRRNKELMPTIVTTNLTLNQIQDQYGARIASRLSDMQVISIKMPDYRKKR